MTPGEYVAQLRAMSMNECEIWLKRNVGRFDLDVKYPSQFGGPALFVLRVHEWRGLDAHPAWNGNGQFVAELIARFVEWRGPTWIERVIAAMDAGIREAEARAGQ